MVFFSFFVFAFVVLLLLLRRFCLFCLEIRGEGSVLVCCISCAVYSFCFAQMVRGTGGSRSKQCSREHEANASSWVQSEAPHEVGARAQGASGPRLNQPRGSFPKGGEIEMHAVA